MKLKLLFVSLMTFAGFMAAAQSLDRPKLVVGIVVDQMRHDYLYRYWDQYGEGGFKRILNEGFSCENAHYNYVPTVTGPGHASIYTGTTPAFHGLIGNEWHLRNSRRGMYCAQDDSVSAVGGSEAAGKMSPKNLLANTITDVLKLYTYNRAKVIGVSVKDRGAIMPAGHLADAAYWYDGNTGKFMTSTYYMNALPAWVNAFNDRNLGKQLFSQGWNTLKPIGTYVDSERDDNPYEGKLNGEANAVFPRNIPFKDPTSYYTLLYTPAGNSLVTEFSKAALEAEQLGQDEVTDFLAMSYSSTDYAGHLFGLHSVEIEDMYLRLDLEMEKLLRFLDEKVGHDKYVVFLSADHAVAQNPQYLKHKNLPVDYFRGWRMIDSLKKFLEKKYDPFLIDGYSNGQIYLNEDRIVSRKLDRKAIAADLKKYVRAWDGVIDVVDRDDIPFLTGGNPVFPMIQKGFYPPLCGDFYVIIRPGWFESSSMTGTTHGSPFTYDTHVPVLWYGWKIPAGKSYAKYEITDIASTLSFLLKIPLPDAATGRVITELFD
ncbi:MAG TPA: alkaline phosphatase family protein [Saprospiraceae bacterium]|nr:alkaline phosphatase family protein [Saprospiraceae bacterium]HNT19883.1 alkaline phosphatase family protein [Saprospiraceae bacterium]